MKYVGLVMCFCALFSVPSGAQEQMPSYEMPIERLDELLMAERPPLLIDLRSPQAYMRIHIPNSLNIQPFALTSKAFLRGKSLLLADEGFHTARLEQLCRQLSEAGLDARYLFGGLLAWQSAGHRLQGDVFAMRELSLIPPQDVIAEPLDASWLIIDASAAPSGLFPQAVSCPSQEAHDAPAFRACVQAALAAQPDGRVRALLVLNETGQHYDEIDALLQNAGVALRWYLRGGAQAYRREVALQQRIAAGRDSSASVCTRASDCLPCSRR